MPNPLSIASPASTVFSAYTEEPADAKPGEAEAAATPHVPTVRAAYKSERERTMAIIQRTLGEAKYLNDGDPPLPNFYRKPKWGKNYEAALRSGDAREIAFQHAGKVVKQAAAEALAENFLRAPDARLDLPALHAKTMARLDALYGDDKPGGDALEWSRVDAFALDHLREQDRLMKESESRSGGAYPADGNWKLNLRLVRTSDKKLYYMREHFGERKNILGTGSHATVMSARRLPDRQEAAAKITHTTGRNAHELREAAQRDAFNTGTLPRRRQFSTIRSSSWLSESEFIQIIDKGRFGDAFEIHRLVHAHATDEERDKIYLSIMQAVCEGMEHVHIHDKFHGDLKLENLVLTAAGEWMIIDWGSGDYGLDEKSPVRGTRGSFDPGFFTDRQARSARAVDLYAAGVVAHVLATGSRVPDGVDFPPALAGKTQTLAERLVPRDAQGNAWTGYAEDALEGASLFDVARLLMHKDPAKRPGWSECKRLPYFAGPARAGQELAELIESLGKRARET